MWKLRPSGGHDSAGSQPQALGEPPPGMGCPVSPAGSGLVVFIFQLVDSLLWVTLVFRAKKYGPVVRVNVFHKTSVIVTSPESVKVGSNMVFMWIVLPIPGWGHETQPGGLEEKHSSHIHLGWFPKDPKGNGPFSTTHCLGGSYKQDCWMSLRGDFAVGPMRVGSLPN